jgi:hypothetical protein
MECCSFGAAGKQKRRPLEMKRRRRLISPGRVRVKSRYQLVSTEAA